MKLEFDETSIERSASFTTQEFAIGNVRIIMDILRSKMYPDPIKTICQEIGSNARDAHREAGHNDPIVIKLPTYIDPTFFIRDYGLGISPDRMANVFIKYGNSTKREDDLQTGGFGLGAKSPFAYADLFSIITITDETDGTRKKREYVAYIDESKIGAMSLVKEEDTTDRTGTTIMLKPKPGDETKFRDKVKSVFRYWSVKPEVHSEDEFTWDEFKYSVEHKNDKGELLFAIQKDGENYPIAIIDEIPYKLIDFPFDDDNLVFKSKPIRLFFKTGELAVTANREGIDTQEWVVEAIANRFKLAKEFLETDIRAQIAKAANAWEAWIITKQFQEYSIKDVEWGKVKLNGYLNIDSTLVEDYVEYSYYSYYNKVQSMRPYCGGEYRIPIGQNNRVVEFTKGKGVPRAKLMPLFKDGAEKIYCVRFKEGVTKPDDWNAYGPLHVDNLIAEKKVSTGTGGAVTIPKSRVISDIPKNEWQEAEIDLDEGDTTYVLVYRNDFIDPSTKEYLSLDTVRRLKKILNIEVVTLLKRYEDKVGPNWTPLSDMLKGYVLKYAPGNQYLDISWDKSPASALGSRTVVDAFVQRLDEIVDKNSPAYIYFNKYRTFKNANLEAIPYNNIEWAARYSKIKLTKIQKDFKAEYNAYVEDYPLISALPYTYRIDKNDKYINEMIAYINFKDEIRNQLKQESEKDVKEEITCNI